MYISDFRFNFVIKISNKIRRVSFANNLGGVDVILEISLIYNMVNKRGPRTDPCGTS